MRGKNRVIFLVGLFLFLLVPLTVCAAPRMCEIDVEFEEREEDGEMIELKGAKFIIFPVQYKENGAYVWRDEFAGCGVSLEDTSADAREKQAKALFQYACEHRLPGIEHITDGNGMARFPDLAEGIYLVAQEEKRMDEDGKGGYMSEPFLVVLPTEIDGELEYDVEVEPKTAWSFGDGDPAYPGYDPEDPDNPENPEDPTNPENPENPENPTDEKEPDKTPSKTQPEKTPVKKETTKTNVVQRFAKLYRAKSVKTGDMTPVEFLITTCMVSGGTFVILWVIKRKISENSKK